MSNDDEPKTHTEKGISLARGPALILGTILLTAGLYFLYKQHIFPKFSQIPNGHVTAHKVFLGIFGANGWTGMLTAVAGGLLLFGAAQHLLAKTMSLIVGIALGIAAVIALVSGNVLGMAAANIWTEVLWGGSAAILLFNTVIPRRKKTITEEPVAARETRQVEPRETRQVETRQVEPRDTREVETRQVEPRDTRQVETRQVEPQQVEPRDTRQVEPAPVAATAPTRDTTDADDDVPDAPAGARRREQ